MAADYRTLLGLVREFVDDARTLDVCPHCTHDRGGHHDDACLLARAEKAIEPSKPKNDPTIMHVAPQDPCCSAPFGKAARSGALDDAETWNCSKCGTVWRMITDHGNVRNWQPEVNVAVVRR